MGVYSMKKFNKSKIILILSLFISLCFFKINSSAAENTMLKNRDMESQPICDVAYNGANLYVAVGMDGIIKTSKDGTVWKNQVSPATANLRGITYAKGMFIAVGENGAIIASKDGKSWFEIISDISKTLTDIIYSNNRFIAVGFKGEIATSIDGLKWEEKASGFSGNGDNLYGVAYGNNCFIAVGESFDTHTYNYTPILLRSIDGEVWERIVLTLSGGLKSVNYAEGKFIIGGYGIDGPANGWHSNDGIIFTSSDGTTWSKSKIAVRSNMQKISGIAYGKNQFAAIDEQRRVILSPDGINWTRTDLPQGHGTSDIYNIIFSGGQFIITGDNGLILTAADAVNWRGGNSQLYPELESVEYINNQFMAVGGFQGGQGAVMLSKDGMKWRNILLGEIGAGKLFSAAFGKDKYIAVGEKGTVVSSQDFENWNYNVSGVTGTLIDITYAMDKFVAVGEEGIIIISGDGINWTKVITNISYPILGVTNGNGKFIAVGEQYGSSFTLISNDGVNWNKSTLPTNRGIQSIAFGSNKFVACGGYGTILISADGMNWTKANSINWDGYLNSVKYINNKFVVTGPEGIIFYSSDGENWTKEQNDLLDYSGSTTYGNGTYIWVGTSYEQEGLIYNSKDGFKWATSSLMNDFYLKSVIYAEDKYVAIGDSYRSVNTVVLTSSNGIDWDINDAGFKNMERGKKVYYAQGKFFIVGENYTIYTSEDAVSWERTYYEGSYPNKSLNCLWDITYAENKFVAVGEQGKIITSSDGLNWNTQDTGTTERFLKVDYLNSSFVASGYWTKYTSKDTVTWQLESGTLAGVAYGAGKYVKVGRLNYNGNESTVIYALNDPLGWGGNPVYSFDGVIDIRVSYNGEKFIACGDNGIILTSIDGVSWTKIWTDTTAQIFSVTDGKYGYVAVGGISTILSSAQKLEGDLNRDGKIDYQDLMKFSDNYSLKQKDLSYNSEQDMNGDGIIDIYDIVSASKLIGEDAVMHIANLEDETPTGSVFNLPQTVNARMNDGSIKQLSTQWNVTNVDTSAKGIYYFEGSAAGYSKKFYLTLKIDSVISFKDINIENRIREIIGKPTGNIYGIDVTGIVDLDLTFKNITNLSGLENFENLESLNIAYNSFTDLTPIRGLTKLRNLHLMSNNITDLSALENLENLEGLNISYSSVSDLTPIKGLIKLRYLYLGYNKITDLSPLQNLTQLEALGLYYNQISDVSPIENLTKLKSLELSNNKISDILPLKNLINLTTLYLAGNEIADFSPVSGYYDRLYSKDFILN
jgi:Leucine-rich repeat (LRR) protein/photosystem II stability/assembly factor-like uncharacterized protein